MIIKKEKKENDLRNSRSGDISFVDVKEEDKGDEIVDKVPVVERKTVNEEYKGLKQNLDESSMQIENADQEKVVEPLITGHDEEKEVNLAEKIDEINKESKKNEIIEEKLDDKIIKNKGEKHIIGNKEKEGEVKRITKDEDRVKGKLKGNVYATYFKNNGGACFVITLLLIK